MIPFEDEYAIAAADVVSDLCREAFVVHEEKVELPDVADQELLQAVWKKMSGLQYGDVGVDLE